MLAKICIAKTTVDNGVTSFSPESPELVSQNGQIIAPDFEGDQPILGDNGLPVMWYWAALLP